MVGDLLTYLPGDLLAKVDLASMAHGLECRGPFLDHRVVELAAAMPLDRKLRFRPGRSKVVLKRAFADLLPKSIRTRRKMGFGVPVGRWFQDELKHELRDVVLDRSCLDRGLFRPDSVRALVADHLEGRREHGHRLWALVMLELWFRNHIDGSSSR
jgi:asparagine synthase (glutamine-hydrolysing)